MNTLGTTLKESRKLLGFTLIDVQNVTGISNAYLSQLENDKIKSPSVNILSKLSSMYRVSLKDLLAKANLIDKEKAREEEVNLNFAQQVAFRSEDLTEEERDHVLKYLEFIKTQKKV